MTMLLALKIVASFLLIAGPVLKEIRDWKWQDRQKTRYHTVTRGVLAIYTLVACVTVSMLWYESLQSTRTRKQLDSIEKSGVQHTSDNARLKADLAAANATVGEMQKQTTELVIGKNELLSQNARLLDEVKKYSADLEAKDAKIHELQQKVKLSAKGATSSFEFNGMRRTSAYQGEMNLVADTPEYVAFIKMQELEKARDYAGLIQLCRKFIEQSTEWITPYYILCSLYAQARQKQDAITMCEYVIQNAPNDSRYSKAQEIRKGLSAK